MEFTIKTIIKATPEMVYNAWLNSKLHSLMTGGEAIASSAVGDAFQSWDGYIEGINVELEPFTKIKQTWRTTEFDVKDQDSMVEISLQAIDKGTALTLSHTLLPDHGGQYIKGWEEHYFQPMKAYFENV